MSSKLHPLTIKIREDLKQSQDSDNAKAMQKYMKSTMPYRGVKSAPQKKIYQQAFKEFPVETQPQYSLIIKELWNAIYREERYAAIRLAKKYSKFQTLEMLPLYRMMIETGAWWDLVDTIAIDLIGNLLREYNNEMTGVMYEWIEDDDLWIRRTAILSQLKFKKNTNQEMLFCFFDKCLDETSFWIRKAIGWSLREFSKTDAHLVRKFYNKEVDRMSGVTKREVVKYI